MGQELSTSDAALESKLHTLMWQVQTKIPATQHAAVLQASTEISQLLLLDHSCYTGAICKG